MSSKRINICPLKQMYISTLAVGFIPFSWRSVRVAFIPKPEMHIRATFDGMCNAVNTHVVLMRLF